MIPVSKKFLWDVIVPRQNFLEVDILQTNFYSPDLCKGMLGI